MHRRFRSSAADHSSRALGCVPVREVLATSAFVDQVDLGVQELRGCVSAGWRHAREHEDPRLADILCGNGCKCLLRAHLVCVDHPRLCGRVLAAAILLEDSHGCSWGGSRGEEPRGRILTLGRILPSSSVRYS